MPEVIFPDKVLDISERQVEMLQGKGIVSRTRNGEGWTGTSSMDALQAMIEDPSTFVCDFCGEPRAMYEYEVGDFDMAHITTAVTTIHESIGNWVACELCAKLIEADRWDDLIIRSVDGSLNAQEFAEEHRDLARVLIEEMVRGFLTTFKETRSGKRRRIGFQ